MIDPRETDGCKCQCCGRRYRVDLLVPEDLWKKITIRPDDLAAGLLCGRCIMSRIEDLGEFDAFEMRRLP